MKTDLIELLKSMDIQPTVINIYFILIAVIVVTAIVIHFLLHKIFLKYIKKIDQRKTNFITRSLLEFNLFQRLALVFQGLVVYWQIELWMNRDRMIYEIFQICSLTWVSIFGLLSFYSIVDKVFKTLHKKTQTPFFAMQTVIQSIKLVFGLLCLIHIISILLDKSPVAILSGLGAMSAVLMLVFKDTILGFSAGLQLSTNKMLHVGDWIEMPKYGADGDVIDIGLNVIKVRNFDKTITTIPTYALVSDSFKNWQGMRESGGRRIKRSVLIDVNTVRFLTSDEQEKLAKSTILHDYIKNKQKEISEYNEKNNFDLSILTNGRRLTNLGTLRAYLELYLKNHPRVKQDMTIMVRQMAATNYGLPLEIYCFTATTVWIEYECIQSDIFDHTLAVINEFGLRSYQSS